MHGLDDIAVASASGYGSSSPLLCIPAEFLMWISAFLDGWNIGVRLEIHSRQIAVCFLSMLGGSRHGTRSTLSFYKLTIPPICPRVSPDCEPY